MTRKLSKPRSKGRKAPTLAGLKRKAWALLSQCVRQEAADNAGGVDCYTCDGWSHWKLIQAGHAIPGRTGAVLLDEEIIRPQCYRCNVALRGNYQVFIAKLIDEHSLDWWNRKVSDSRSVVKWTRSDLEAKIESYKARLAALA